MSQKHKLAHSAGKILEHIASGLEYAFQGQRVDDPDDVHACITGYTLLFLTWFDLLGISLSEYERRLRTWISAMSGVVDVFAIDAVLSEADELLLESYDSDTSWSYTSLLRDLRQVDDRAGSILAPIRTLLIPAFTDKSVEAFRVAHQALAFASRLTLYKSNEALNQSMVDNWIETDLFCYDPEAGSLRPFFEKHFRYFSMCDAVGSHGTGAIAERSGRTDWYEKWRLMASDDLIELLDHRIGHYPLYRSEAKLRRVARLQLVPKNVRKRRAITIEPATLVWYQHAVRDAILSHINRSRYLRRRIDLERPDLNRSLAERGSHDSSFVTIDLSAASDSVPDQGLRECLPAQMYTALYAVRSQYVTLPDGDTYIPNKYAGMGNAVTFVTECLYFCAIVEQGIREAGGNPYTSEYRVYGDDIVVERLYASSVINCLARHGFKVNSSKSFTNGTTFIFRESCGGEYLNGVDVGPVRLSRGFRGLISSPGAISGSIDFVNRIDLTSVRIYVIDQLQTLKKEHRPMYTLSGSGIHVSYPSNEHLYSRYSFGLQEFLYRHGATVTLLKSGSQQYVEEQLPSGRTQLFSCDAFREAVRYYEYLRIVRNRKRLIWPEDRLDMQLDLPDQIVWGTTSDADH